ncbi:hypothetical protein COOONC_25277 [Cooperia oncophora]
MYRRDLDSKYSEYERRYKDRDTTVVTVALLEMGLHAMHAESRRTIVERLGKWWRKTLDDEKQFILENFPAFKLVDEYAAKQP